MPARRKTLSPPASRRWHPFVAALIGLTLTVLLGKAAAMAKSALSTDGPTAVRTAVSVDSDV